MRSNPTTWDIVDLYSGHEARLHCLNIESQKIITYSFQKSNALLNQEANQ
jgi:hypothetical protein